MKPTRQQIRRLVQEALREDLGSRGDTTALALVPAPARGEAVIITRQMGVLCGVDVVKEVFHQLDSGIHVVGHVRDGHVLAPGTKVFHIRGRARAILSGERTALNFLQRLSGIATLTRQFVRAASRGRTKVRVLDTRKTTPLLRVLEKYAVTCGGGCNHRMGLYDMVMIKDNHLGFLKDKTTISEAVQKARRKWRGIKVEVECDHLGQVQEAVKAGADVILLDNMTPVMLRRAVKLVAGRAMTEASGGVNLRNITRVAKTGVDAISVGALTHSAPAMDLSLEWVGNRC